MTGIAGLLVLLSGVNVSTVATNLHEIGGLATEEYVGKELEAHRTDENRRIAQVESKVDRIRAYTEIVPQLKDLLTLRCMGVRSLDATIEKLEGEFFVLAGEPYREPACERLVIPR